MKWLLLLLLLSVSSVGYSGSCLLKTEAHIRRIMPKTLQVGDIAKAICSASVKYKVNPQIIVAIAAQESSLRPIHRGKLVDTKTKCCMEITDFGVMQVNIHTVKLYSFDRERLRFDLDYQIDCGVKVLADKLRDFGDYATYHSNTPVHREYYRSLVRKYL